MKTKHAIGFFLMGLLALCAPGRAADITATLDTTNGASAFVVNNAASNTLLTVQSDGKVGIGTNAPVEKLHVDGAAVIGNSEAATPVAGTIRWTGSDFEGYTGSEWVSLTVEFGSPAPAGMSRIPMGSFLMGIPYVTNTITISEFYIDEYEVTNLQMANVLQWAYDQGLVGVSGSSVTNNEGDAQELLDLDDSDCQISFSGGTFSIDSGKENFPCVEVTWYGAQAYCNYKSDIDSLERERCQSYYLIILMV